MGLPIEGDPAHRVDRIAEETRVSLDSLGALIEANRVGFEATTDEQFLTRVGRQIGDQRTYAEHLVGWADVRLKAMGIDEGELPDLGSLTRQELLTLASEKRTMMLAALVNPERWDQEFDIPWQGRISGRQLIGRFALHEQRHEDYNRAALDKFDIDFPPQMVAIMGI